MSIRLVCDRCQRPMRDVPERRQAAIDKLKDFGNAFDLCIVCAVALIDELTDRAPKDLTDAKRYWNKHHPRKERDGIRP